MSVLRNKIYRETGLPAYIESSRSIWAPINHAVTDGLADVTGREWEPVSVDVAQIDSKTFLADYPDAGLAYMMKSADGQIPVLAHFDKTFAAITSTKALSLDAAKADEEYVLHVLDQILFKPVRDILIKELSTVFVSGGFKNGRLALISEGLSAAIFEVERGTGVLNRVTFSVKQVALEDEDKDAPEPKGEEITLNYSVVLPQNVLAQIVSSRESAAADPSLDQPGPWADRIYQSMKTATVPIRAVVESCEMTVADCTRLEVDDVIQLPGASLQSVSMQTDMRDGAVKIGSASLGIYKSNWALKLSGDLNEEIFVSLKSENINA